MEILIVSNLLLQYIKVDNMEGNRSKQKIECIRCGSKMGEITVCQLKCFKCGSELICSE